MFTTDFLLIVITIGISFILLFITYILRILYITKKRDSLKNDGNVVLSYPREKVEEQIYDITDKYLSTKKHYDDMYHLVLQDDDSRLVIKQNVVDQSFFVQLGIELSQLKVNEKQVMCLMPFHRRFYKIYASITKACDSLELKVVRSDNEFVTGDILKYTIHLILTSQIVIAVLDGRNANVFYEIGIAQAVGKTVILVSDISKFQDVPFDLKNNRILLYKDLEDLRSKIVDVFKDMPYVIARKEK